MAKHLIRHIGATMSATVASLAICWPCEVLARDLPDPTRPSGSLGQAPGGAGKLPGAAEDAAALQLQSVIVSPERKVAIINGKTVRLGEKIGDAVVAKITEGEVVLRTGKDLQTLKLFPGLEKRQDRNGQVPNKTTDDIKTR
jgi:MSHA biogenesis protein MshK